MEFADSADERILDCAFCGSRFFGIPDLALFGWDDDVPVYICTACDIAQRLRAVYDTDALME